MASEELDSSFSELRVTEGSDSVGKSDKLEGQGSNDDVQITCFTEDLHDVTFHFQILKLTKQVINICLIS